MKKFNLETIFDEIRVIAEQYEFDESTGTVELTETEITSFSEEITKSIKGFFKGNITEEVVEEDFDLEEVDDEDFMFMDFYDDDDDDL